MTKNIKEKRTIYTVAKELGIAPGTVSKVINHTGNVSQATRDRVLQYIKDVGYVPTKMARILKSKRTYTIGVVFLEELEIGLEHPFFSSILQHFKTTMEKEGYEISFIVKRVGQHQMSYYEWCMNKRVDGVYIVVGNDGPEIQELVNSGIPCVSTDLIMPGLYTIISDNNQGIELLLKFTKETLQKKRVAYLSGPLNSKSFEERLIAFQKFAPIYGIEFDEHHLAIAKSYGFTSGFEATHYLLKQMKQPPEVIIVASDDLALGTLKAIKDLGYRIPEDIQVTGFDDIAYSRHFTPPLTTIHQYRDTIGQTAAKALISLIENPDQPTHSEITRIPVKLVERESTKARK